MEIVLVVDSNLFFPADPRFTEVDSSRRSKIALVSF